MDKISPIKQRILNFVEKTGITKLDFCEKTGISYANLKGKSLFSEIGGTQIAEILSIYDKISPEWLLTGNGEMLREQEKSHATKEQVACGRIQRIPLIPIEAVAGFGTIDNLGVSVKDCEHYIIPDFTERGVEFLIKVSGSSMYPKYSGGDVLACKKIKDMLYFQWGKIYVIDSSQGILVKRIFQTDDDDFISCVSDNTNYPPFKLPKLDVRSLSIVVGVIRLE